MKEYIHASLHFISLKVLLHRVMGLVVKNTDFVRNRHKCIRNGCLYSLVPFSFLVATHLFFFLETIGCE